ncbi:MAG TPA: 16S rRNA (guanine(527)-N(7))-methyltransferase RsmG [Lacibacter sp.]|nr:16S rRNA (guanine(527)-N(7))-methyltransferase RsmG [Lacibacter sp.]HMO87709.1 16S rRNA (guanine(527)-N(7))-methyltransferase RsmG [Lacibacter sp.]HMP86237.1 16S rRNA (guanine(527)-N(7))-methyltransferase RsmG [Lacibacter sp.]
MDLLLNYFSGFTDVQRRQLEQLQNVYTEWNDKINVISRKDIDSLYEKHVLHSLAIAAVFDFQPGTQIADLGTGGGFPGIPLAIFFPEVEFLLTDSIGKKLKVVEAVVEATGLKNVTTRHTRAETITDRKFDFIVSRAVAPLRELWQWSRPLLKARGQGQMATAGTEKIYGGLICLKGGNLEEEIRESGLHPLVWEIEQLFREPFFKEKYILAVPR